MEFRRLHDSLGVEVLDFDVLAPTAAADVAALQRAFDDHQLLLFRGGPRIPPARQVEISSWFGPLIEDVGDGKQWTTLSNVDDGGRRVLPFHSDFTYTHSPIQGITLHAIEVPDGGTATAFASGITAWATLPAEQQRGLAGLTVRHSYDSPSEADLPHFVADHPVRLLHPRTGVPVLFVTEYHAERILELDAEESDRVLAGLCAHLYAPERVYVHGWQLHDLVIWDNLVVQHARPEEADRSAGARTFQRVALNDYSYPQLIALARDAAVQGA